VSYQNASYQITKLPGYQNLSDGFQNVNFQIVTFPKCELPNNYWPSYNVTKMLVTKLLATKLLRYQNVSYQKSGISTIAEITVNIMIFYNWRFYLAIFKMQTYPMEKLVHDEST